MDDRVRKSPIIREQQLMVTLPSAHFCGVKDFVILFGQFKKFILR